LVNIIIAIIEKMNFYDHKLI